MNFSECCNCAIFLIDILLIPGVTADTPLPDDARSCIPDCAWAGSLGDLVFPAFDGTFQYLTGLPSFPDPQTLRRFLLRAPPQFWDQLHRVNNRLLQKSIHLPEHSSRLIFDLDITVMTVFGHQDGAEVGYNTRHRGKRSYNPMLCMEANPHTSGMPNCAPVTPEPGTAARIAGYLLRQCSCSYP